MYDVEVEGTVYAATARQIQFNPGNNHSLLWIFQYIDAVVKYILFVFLYWLSALVIG